MQSEQLYSHVMTPQREETMSNQEIDSCARTSYSELFLEPASELADRLYLVTRFCPIVPTNPRESKRLQRAQANIIRDLHDKLQDSIDSLSVALL